MFSGTWFSSVASRRLHSRLRSRKRENCDAFGWVVRFKNLRKSRESWVGLGRPSESWVSGVIQVQAGLGFV